MATSCAPLRLRSNYSLLTGATSLPGLLERGRELGFTAMALTDENNLYGACLFFELAQKAGIRPILGAIVTAGHEIVTLLASDATGYANLSSLLSRRNLREDFNLKKELAGLQEGLFICTEDPDLARALLGSVDRSRLYLELVRPGRSLAAQRRILEESKTLGLPIVASSDAYFAKKEEVGKALALRAIRTQSTLSHVQKDLPLYVERYVRGPDEMAHLYGDCPEALREADRLLSACDFQLLGRPAVFPKVEEDKDQAIQRLKEAAFRGAQGRYAGISPSVRSRLDYEIDIIGRLGFADYFLVVADIVSFARALGTPTAGRGSGASSVVSYCLGITNVDPLSFDLPFERFLNSERQDYPDLDIDFCWRLRDQVIDYVYRKYGRDHVAMVATYATMRPRLAFRESGRAHGLSDSLISEVARRLEGGLPPSGGSTLPVEPQTLDGILGLAKAIEDFPHHLSVHCGGVVITPGPIERHAPLQMAEKGVVIVQYDKEGVEAVGLVKLDLLGNRAVSTIGEAARLLRSQAGIDIDPERLPDRDPLTVQILQTGATLGCNQLESPGMRSLLRMVRPSSLKDVMKVLALIRPGAASLGMKDAFIRRARGLEVPVLQDPAILKILGDTYGIMLYEDDALLVAAYLADLPPEKADRFRRAVTKCRSDEERLKLSQEFLGRCQANGKDEALARDLWIQMAKFNSYSFCRAHAASYALLSWALAFLKAHHPACFWVAALNNNVGMYAKWVYAEAAKRGKIPIFLPCVNRSGLEFSLDRRGIRVGLNLVFNLSEKTIEGVFKAREEGPFEGLWDFLRRVPSRMEEVENLIRVGAFDFTRTSRTKLLWSLHLSFKSRQKLCQEKTLLCPSSPSFAVPDLPDFSLRDKARDEWRLLGLSARDHPLHWFERDLRRHGVWQSANLSSRVGHRVRMAGLVAAGKDTTTTNGEDMGFITLDDQDGLFEVTVFPREYSRLRGAFTALGPYLVEGLVNDQYGASSLIADKVTRLPVGP